jgi:hypothetical protein
VAKGVGKVWHVHLDVVGGIAGDMFVAALLDALPELQSRVLADAAAVIPESIGRPQVTEGQSGGLAARRFGLASMPNSAAEHRGTRFRDLAARIGAAGLHSGTAEQALGILRRLAEAEARLHRVPLDDVHFHELADWDSLLDVVAAGSIAAALPVCTWSVSDLPRGHGLVRTQHGLLPVPAPATAELLRGFRWRDDGVGGERVTPTGGAILAHLAPATQPPATNTVLHAVGIGAGTRELQEMPNILRALVFGVDSAAAALPGQADEVIVVSFDIDDMTGEEIGTATEHLRSIEGVLDLSLGSRQGKKGRPVTDVRLLIQPAALARVSAACFLQTSTLGLRWRREHRRCLGREQESIQLDGTALRRKRSRRPDGETSVKVESDDLAAGTLRERRQLRARAEGDR